MNHKTLIYKSIVAVSFVTMLFSCGGNSNEIDKFNQEVDGPIGESKIIHLIYTDSGRVSADLKSPKMLDYSQEKSPYKIFPIGVEVDFFDKDSSKTNIIADYSIIYEYSDLIDMRGNVKIVTSDSTVLTTSQLYWDTKKEWVFTDRAYKIKLPNGTENEGGGFDADQNFSLFNSRSNSGIQIIEDDL